MATHVQVILREDVDNLGSSGELVRVRPGFARNYLIPRGLAVAATRGNIAQIEHERRAAVTRAAKLRTELEAMAKSLEGNVAHIQKQAGEGGKLYGSVTAQDIAEALASQGVDVDRRKLSMPDEPIKTIGTHKVTLKLGSKVHVDIKVDVTPADS
ncbi:MAG TPA: 50S ribosomal protein L9 [Polyangiaceae bacterium LLY-WYZ-14_1]|jgi:large subunit ribosomal protein L9|nr:50S ribosomal protein L9 [Polyangiaceae bacterium LLY-WYZ-14_1]